jgi:hypothetical protein
MTITLEFDEAQLAKIMQIPLLMRLGPSERVLKAMSVPVVAKAKAIAPSSRRSGTRKKWSKKYKDNPAYQNDSGKQIGVKYLKNNRGGILIIGGKHPQANKQNYDSGKPRRVFYWGKDAGKVKRIDPKERFMQKAYDETRGAQISAGNAQLDKELKELKLG